MRASIPRLRPFLKERRERRRMPERIEAVVSAYEGRAERLTGWVQLGVGVFLALFYLLIPEPAASVLRWVEPVGFAVYLAFVAGLLAWSYRARLPRVLFGLSILVDLALLFGLIYSLHLRYGEAPAFYLKAPALLYVFVFIAVRALRIDAFWVGMTGISAALGWAGMTAYAIHASGPDAMTTSFQTYLTSARILPGVEVDKVVAILAVTAIISLGLVRSRTLLLSAVRDQIAREDLSRFLPGAVHRAITESPTEILAGDAEEREAAIMMLDIRGFSGFAAEATPQEVVDVLVQLHARIVPIVATHGGAVDKYLGDGMLALFTATTAPADALSALCEIIEAGRRWTEGLRETYPDHPLRLNGAVTSGRVVFAAIGDSGRLELAAIGNAVNLAAKLEKHNKREGTLALSTAETFSAAKRCGFEPPAGFSVRPARSIDGVSASIDLVVVAA